MVPNDRMKFRMTERGSGKQNEDPNDRGMVQDDRGIMEERWGRMMEGVECLI